MDGEIGLVEIVNEQWKADVSDLLQQETDRLKALARAEVDDFGLPITRFERMSPLKTGVCLVSVSETLSMALA
nr:hypothetical protein [Proteus terrae subsp. cibarius]